MAFERVKRLLNNNNFLNNQNYVIDNKEKDVFWDVLGIDDLYSIRKYKSF